MFASLNIMYVLLDMSQRGKSAAMCLLEPHQP